jgi:endonuclease YncB( thermonuclease family)
MGARSLTNFLAIGLGLLLAQAACADVTGKVVSVTDGDTITVLDANLAQVTAEMAWWYRYYAREPSPDDRGRYESAEDEARARGWGLWADPNPINPYDWRKGRR